MTELQREAKRFVAIRATKNGTPVVPDQYAVTAWDVRPIEADWINVVVKGPDVGWYQQPSDHAQDYKVWARWDDALEEPVEVSGTLSIL